VREALGDRGPQRGGIEAASACLLRRPVALAATTRYNHRVPARPLVFAFGLVLCLAGAITCATAPAGDPQAFPSLSDGLVIGGFALVVLGVAGRDARGRQLLGRRGSSSRPSAGASPSAAPSASTPAPERSERSPAASGDDP
jgi:hypothetical protein